MSEYVYVVTSLEMGWDCVCGVYRTNEDALRYIFDDWGEEYTEEQLQERYDNSERDTLIIHDKRLGAK